MLKKRIRAFVWRCMWEGIEDVHHRCKLFPETTYPSPTSWMSCYWIERQFGEGGARITCRMLCPMSKHRMVVRDGEDKVLVEGRMREVARRCAQGLPISTPNRPPKHNQHMMACLLKTRLYLDMTYCHLASKHRTMATGWPRWWECGLGILDLCLCLPPMVLPAIESSRTWLCIETMYHHLVSKDKTVIMGWPRWNKYERWQGLTQWCDGAPGSQIIDTLRTWLCIRTTYCCLNNLHCPAFTVQLDTLSQGSLGSGENDVIASPSIPVKLSDKGYCTEDAQYSHPRSLQLHIPTLPAITIWPHKATTTLQTRANTHAIPGHVHEISLQLDRILLMLVMLGENLDSLTYLGVASELSEDSTGGQGNTYLHVVSGVVLELSVDAMGGQGDGR
ncbi:hypothetical protein ARMGADRAFT_1029433 [Armillaria gallica]|uniref:Uncharacterized protein n=1 Tax=Armillaria gallica TaxID=47427 RepID=A0A2H3E172_ARMGA|nr:hypothetical protein ARMGADRAFT_1029433 [Armillaria gallica]